MLLCPLTLYLAVNNTIAYYEYEAWSPRDGCAMTTLKIIQSSLFVWLFPLFHFIMVEFEPCHAEIMKIHCAFNKCDVGNWLLYVQLK